MGKRLRFFFTMFSTSGRTSGSLLPLIFCIHVRSGPIYWGGVIYLAEKIIRWWYFICKKPENIIGDGILHINTFHYFKIPYFTCTFFTKFTYNEYIGPYFLSHVVLRFSPVISPREEPVKIYWKHTIIIHTIEMSELHNINICIHLIMQVTNIKFWVSFDTYYP
jgi:hypothetical protein